MSFTLHWDYDGKINISKHKISATASVSIDIGVYYINLTGCIVYGIHYPTYDFFYQAFSWMTAWGLTSMCSPFTASSLNSFTWITWKKRIHPLYLLIRFDEYHTPKHILYGRLYQHHADNTWLTINMFINVKCNKEWSSLIKRYQCAFDEVVH